MSGTRGWARSCEYNDKQVLSFWGWGMPEEQLPVVTVRDQYTRRVLLHPEEVLRGCCSWAGRGKMCTQTTPQ